MSRAAALEQERDAALAEVERLKVALGRAEALILRHPEGHVVTQAELILDRAADILELAADADEEARSFWGSTPKQLRAFALSIRHKSVIQPPELRAEVERLGTDKAFAVQQAQINAQEMRTQRAIVLGILRGLGLPLRDYEAERLVLAEFAKLREENERLNKIMSAAFLALPLVERGDAPCWTGDNIDFFARRVAEEFRTLREECAAWRELESCMRGQDVVVYLAHLTGVTGDPFTVSIERESDDLCGPTTLLAQVDGADLSAAVRAALSEAQKREAGR